MDINEAKEATREEFIEKLEVQTKVPIEREKNEGRDSSWNTNWV